MRKPRSIWLGAAMLGIAALGVIWFLKANSPHVVEPENIDTETSSGVAPQTMSASKESAISRGEFSLEQSSLRGTEVDGGILLNANGEVVLDPGMRRLFDYYLSLIGERDLIQIRVLLKEHLLGNYGAVNAEIVLQYFDRYTDYLNALTNLKIGNTVKPEERLKQVTVLRQKMLGEEMVTAFFADEEALAALTLKRMAIANDKNRSADEKTKMLAELDAAENYSARTEADTAALITEQTRQLDASHLTEAQRAAERETLWGKEAAERLAQLDLERARWDARIEQYLLARSRIDANRSLSVTARAQAIAALRAQQFNAVEQRRIASLEAIGQLKPGG
ncbi:MAG: lipase secretion chaperone [Arenimonas sp.]